MNCRTLFCLLILNVSIAFAQKLPNIAISPFVGDKNVTPEQLNFLTGKFAGELITTQVFNVLDRGKMDYILKEQGFQQTGLCNSSECQVQMGQMLGVDFIVTGNLVRFGSKFAFRADYIDVGSGKVVYFVEQNASGELEDVYEALCEGAAKKLALKVAPPVATTVAPVPPPVTPAPVAIAEALVPPPVTPAPVVIAEAPVPLPVTPAPVVIAEAPVPPPVIPPLIAIAEAPVPPPVISPPSPVIPAQTGIQSPAPVVPADALPAQPSKPLSGKRKFALALWGSSLLGAGGGYYFDKKGGSAQGDYEVAAGFLLEADAKVAYDKVQIADRNRNIGYGASIGTLLIGAVLWFLPEGK